MFKNLLEIFLFRLLYYFVKILPLSTAYAFAKVLALINFWILKIRVEVVVKQLREAFPEKTKKEVRRIAKETFINFSKDAVEFCWFSSKSLAERIKYVSIYGLKNIDLALSYNKGLILMMGHLGNWELGGQLISLLTNKLYAVTRKQRNPYFNKFIDHIRTSNKDYLIPKKYAFRRIVGTLKRNEIVLMLVDQDSRRNGVFVDFFGRPASTYPGIAKISLKLDCPIIFSACLRQPNGKYKFYIEKPIFLERSKNLDEDVEKYTQKLTTLLEKWIRQYPSQWFWLHKRWKTKKFNA